MMRFRTSSHHSISCLRPPCGGNLPVQRFIIHRYAKAENLVVHVVCAYTVGRYFASLALVHSSAIVSKFARRSSSGQAHGTYSRTSSLSNSSAGTP